MLQMQKKHINGYRSWHQIDPQQKAIPYLHDPKALERPISFPYLLKWLTYPSTPNSSNILDPQFYVSPSVGSFSLRFNHNRNPAPTCRNASFRMGMVRSSPFGMAKKMPMLLLAVKSLKVSVVGSDKELWWLEFGTTYSPKWWFERW